MFGPHFHFHKKEKDPSAKNAKGTNAAGNQNTGDSSDPYGGNVQYRWNYDDYQKALAEEKETANRQKQENGPYAADFQAVDPSAPVHRKKRGLRIFVVSLCCVFGVAVLGFAGYGITSMVKNGGLNSLTSSSGTTKGITLTSKPTSTTSSSSSGLQMTAAQVVSKVKTSVVAIVVYDLNSVDASAEGSGIIISTDGYIVTNAHVISGGQKFEVDVTTSSGTTKSYDATKVGSDTRTDLAVLKISATGLTAATFGNSDQLSVGESVLAIGNPGGTEFSGSVTSGIVSALNRQVTSNGYTQSYIQTDAPINPGNSGGALFNMYGQVVGITSSKIEETGYEGMGFAIPINDVQPIVNSLIKNGYVTGRVKIGLSVSPFTEYQAKLYSLPTGLLVASVDSSSDASKQGVEENDIITKINDVTVTSGDSDTWYNNFYKEESKYKSGDTVTLTVARYQSGGSYKTLTFKVKLEEDKGTTSSSSTSSDSEDGTDSSGSYSYNYSYGSSSDSGDDTDSGFSLF